MGRSSRIPTSTKPASDLSFDPPERALLYKQAPPGGPAGTRAGPGRDLRSGRMEELKDDPDSLNDLGTEWVSRLCQQLLDMGAPGILFYTLNQAKPALRIPDNLNLQVLIEGIRGLRAAALILFPAFPVPAPESAFRYAF